MSKMQGRVCVITGGKAGIGRAVAVCGQRVRKPEEARRQQQFRRQQAAVNISLELRTIGGEAWGAGLN